MTGEELFNIYRDRSSEDLEYGMIDPMNMWVWEQAAKFVGAFGGSKPEDQIRSVKAGENL